MRMFWTNGPSQAITCTRAVFFLASYKISLKDTANSPEVCKAKETLAINYKGPEMAIAFNLKYLIDPLNALVNDEVFLELIDELSPGVLKINGPFLYVVMPMRLT